MENPDVVIIGAGGAGCATGYYLASAGKKVMIVAHGNSLRSLVKHLDNISDNDIISLNIPTGIPLIYELNNKLKPVKSYYLGSQKNIEQAISSVKNQAKAK